VESVQQQVASILDPIHRHTALIKIQGPFTDTQLESITKGIVYLEKLGLVSVIIVERDDWAPGDEQERSDVVEESARVVRALERQGARARPIFQAISRLGPTPDGLISAGTAGAELSLGEPMSPPEAHVLPGDLGPVRSALRAGEIPVLTPFALDSYCRTVRIDANDLIAALARGMVEASALEKSAPSSSFSPTVDFDLTPLRLMIINREGGIPSYARSGLPHLLINLTSESHHIQSTFLPAWRETHPTALSNLRLAQSCLAYMPPSSSAVVVSHRSPRSLIANLITNKPAHSSSLPHALLSGDKALTPHTPTIIRAGLPIRVIREANGIDLDKMTRLLETSFGRKLDQSAFYSRVERDLDFCIIVGDYAGAAIVTNESEREAPSTPSSDSLPPVKATDGTKPPIAYLDKFAVLPTHQGDGTVDFLWVALYDESYGLGLASALNPNPGGSHGRGVGRDLVWRSRSDNPVNKWYFERSSGHLRINASGGAAKTGWSMFWCDAEERLAAKEKTLKDSAEKELMEWAASAPSAAPTPSLGLPRVDAYGKSRWGVGGLSFLEDEDQGRMARWAKIVESIPSSWSD
jgi:amino-acid N-acetyltransferase